ncbi:MAG: enoyl-CoA hydratase-related protein [Dehalococcoidia bacterium]
MPLSTPTEAPLPAAPATGRPCGWRNYGRRNLCTVADGVATVTMNRPEKRNALNDAMLDGMVETFDRLDADRSVRVVLVRGAGMSFCSGLDLRERSRAVARRVGHGLPRHGAAGGILPPSHDCGRAGRGYRRRL